MKTIIGLIDFGSNTFHLVIASVTEDSIDIIFRKREHVFLAQEGIKYIAPEAMERGFSAVKSFYEICRRYGTEQILSVGTSALRSAENRNVFLDKIKSDYGISPQIIDGQREAELIFKGVSLVCPKASSDALVMDIGGGSTEFTITRNGQIVFQESLEIGLGVLHAGFHFSNPVTTSEIEEIYHFFEEKGNKLADAIKRSAPKNLIGCSGTFDVLAYGLTGKDFAEKKCTKTVPGKFRTFLEAVIHSTLEERMARTDIPDTRVELIVHAFLTIRWILDLHPFPEIVFSSYALKEGLLHEFHQSRFSKIKNSGKH